MILNHMRCLNEDAIGCLIFARPPSANEPYNACLTRPARQDTMDLGMSLLANQPLIIGLICRKKPANIRHPMGSASPCFKTARMQGERRWKTHRKQRSCDVRATPSSRSAFALPADSIDRGLWLPWQSPPYLTLAPNPKDSFSSLYTSSPCSALWASTRAMKDSPHASVFVFFVGIRESDKRVSHPFFWGSSKRVMKDFRPRIYSFFYLFQVHST